MEIRVIDLSWPDECNIVVGQSHFIKTVEDVSEIMIGTVPQIEYGLAFCEASGPCLIRKEGNNQELVEAAVRCARDVGAGHSLFLLLRKAYPINVLNALKNCPEVARIFCATANPLQVLTVETDQGRGIIGVVDGYSPKGVEGEAEVAERKSLLRNFGYKF